jgi:hypothetical protein
MINHHPFYPNQSILTLYYQPVLEFQGLNVDDKADLANGIILRQDYQWFRHIQPGNQVVKLSKLPCLLV